MDGNEIAHAKKLVYDLYSGSLSPSAIAATEKELQKAQRSQQGWNIGLFMLQSKVCKVIIIIIEFLIIRMCTSNFLAL